MRALRPQRLELLDDWWPKLRSATALGSTGLLEKEKHLTDAPPALFALRLGGMYLAFCGGTL